MIGFSFIIVGGLILIASLFSAIETAITAASPARMHKLKTEGSHTAQIVLKLLKIKEKVISTFLILYSIMTTIAITIATSSLVMLYGEERGAIIASLSMAMIIVIFAEVIPKAVAIAKAEQITLATAQVVRFFMWLFKPVNFALSKIVRIFCFICGINLRHQISATEEVKGIIKHHHAEGNVFKSDKDMLEGVLEISNMDVSDIMIHRSQMCTIQADLPMHEIINQALETPYSRIPVWRGSKENIIGILRLRDLMRALKKQNFQLEKMKLSDFIHEPWFIPDNALVSYQLNAFRQKRYHIALIVNEYGDLQGLITLEDILEEIVGHIEDEHDKIADDIIKKGRKRFVIDGTTTIRDINRELEWNLSDEHATTIAGVIIHGIGRIPEQGEQFELFGLKILIRKKVNNKIKAVIAEVIEPKEDLTLLRE